MGKADELTQNMIKYDLDLVCVFETWAAPFSRPPNDTFIYWSPFPATNESPRARHYDYGIGVAIHPRWLAYKHHLKVLSLGRPGISSALSWGHWPLGAIYLPPKATIEECQKILKEITHALPANSLLLGDFNMRLGALTGDRLDNPRGIALQEWLSHQDHQWSICIPDHPQPTFISHKRSSIVDYIMCAKDVADDVLDMGVLSSEDIGGSDHRLIHVTLKEKGKPLQKEKKFKKINLKNLEKEKNLYNYLKDVSDALLRVEFPAQWDCLPGSPQAQQLVNFIDLAIFKAISESAAKNLGFCKRRIRVGKLYTPELANAKKARRKAFNIWRKNRDDPNSFLEYKAAKKDERKKIKSAAKTSFLRFSLEMNDKTSCEQSKILRHLRTSRTKSTGTELHTDQESLEEYAEHFRLMYREEIEEQRHTPSPNLWRPPEVTQKLEIDESTVRIVLESLPNGKASGRRNVANELLKNAAEILAPTLTYLFNAVLYLETCPTSWKTGIIHPVYKKGPRTSISNYRPIVVLDTMRRVFENALLRDLLLDIVEPLNICQGGFRAKRGTIDQVASLNELILSRFKKTGRWPIVAYLDIKSAYDRVDRALLWPLLEGKSCPSTLIRTLANLFHNVETTLNVRGVASKSIVHERGLVQGSILSPILYALYINDLAERLRPLGTSKFGIHSVPALLYADDIAMLADTPCTMQAMLDECERFAVERRFFFAPDKCAFTADPEKSDASLFIHGLPIKNVAFFRYLGVTMNYKGVDRAAHANAMALSLNDTLRFFRSVGFHGNGLTIPTKVQLYKTFLRPKLEYGIQLLNKTATKRLQREQNFCLRCLFSLPRNTSIAVLHTLSGLPSLETRRRVLFAKWMAKTRKLGREYMVKLAYDSTRPKPSLASSFYWEKQEKFLLPKRDAPQPKNMKKDIESKAKTLHQKDYTAWKKDKVPTQSLPEELDAKTLQRKLEAFESPAATQALIRWIARRPTSRPNPCLNCKEGRRSTVEHVQTCTMENIDEMMKRGDFESACARLPMIYRKCFGWKETWTSAHKRKEPP